jgi:DNA replication protein DnaC
MLTAQTLKQLQALKLTAMAAAWTAQPQTAELTALSFDERFALLVDAEWRAREDKRLGRALREAKLKLPHASIEAIDYPARRELDKAVIRQLATCRWVDEYQQVLISGATGVGKTFIACALGNQAGRKGYRARYWRASRLYHACALARADGTYGRFLGQLARVDVLVLDDWALSPCRTPSAATSWKSSRTAPAPGRPSSPVSCPRRGGTTTWPTPPWPTPSAIGSSTTPIESCYKDPHGERRRSSTASRRRPASLRSDHDPRSARSPWSDLAVHDGRNAQPRGDCR